MYVYNARVERVVDGDTVYFEVDLGFSVSMYIKARLYGINTPEMNTQAGKDAKAYVESLIPVGSEVEIETLKDKTGKYGRYLVIIHYGPTTVNKKLVDEGYAVEYMT